MPGTTRLNIYNDALMLCGERFLASLTEDREPRRLLDQVWDSNGVNYCLEQGQWQFAMRTQQLDYDPDMEPPFGYQYAFEKPTDWILTSAVCTDGYFTTPLIRYADEMGYWFADLQTIYVKFVSNDANYGGSLAMWPSTFASYVSAYFASQIIGKLSGKEKSIVFLMGNPGDLDGGELGRRLTVAKNRAMMTQATQFPAQGAWVRSRFGRRSNWDRGNPGSLTG